MEGKTLRPSWFQRFAGPYLFARKSYAQCGEDLILRFLLEGLHKETGTYLDIGAHHPYYLNNTYLLYARHWQGANIDPLSENIEQFDAVRPRDLNVCCGIASTTGVRDLYVFDPKTLSTFDPETAERYKLQGHRISEVRQVQMLDVGDLLNRCELCRNVDLLSIDIEGGEIEVISGLLERGVAPSVIVCETVGYAARLPEAVKDLNLVKSICDLGYLAYADTFVNTIFVSKDKWRKRQ